MSRPFHIALVFKGMGRGWLGGFEYIKSLALALNSLSPEVQAQFKVTLLTGGPLEKTEDAQMETLVSKIVSIDDNLPSRNVAHRLKLHIRKQLFQEIHSRVDDLLNHHQVDFVYPYLPDHATPKSYSYAAWIPDFQHKYLTQFFSKEEIDARECNFQRMARTAPLVVLSSCNAEQDFKKFFPFAAEKSRVLSFRTPRLEKWFQEPPLTILQKYNLPEKFYFVANQFWKHKNHLLVFSALKRLSDEGLNIPVVFTGNLHDYRFPEYGDTILQTIHQLGIHRQVYLLGVVPRVHYFQLLRGCAAVIQPSLFEGWSTVVEDARMVGKSIILSDIDVHREQKPARAVFFKRASAEDLAFHLQQEWRRLTAGPDSSQEETAQLENARDLQVVGNRLLEIAHEACLRGAGIISKTK